jgi:hypothetical protein
MTNSRSGWLGLVATVVILALAGWGWRALRSPQVSPDATPTSPLAAQASPPRAEGTGTARLSWSPVEATQPGADPVAGYRVYVGASPDALRLEATIADPRVISYVVTRLPKGTHYFAVTSYTALGIESPYSPPVAKTIE